MDSHSSSAIWNVQPRFITFLAHILGVVAVVLVLIWTIHFRGGLAFSASNKNLIFNIHPVLMLISFIFLGGEAILAFKTLPGSHETRKRIHSTIHFTALVLAIIGIYAVFKFHNESQIDNLYSLHSWLGLITVVLYGCQWLMGFVSFLFPRFRAPARAAFLPWHIFFGLLVYGLAVATSELGFLEKMTFLQWAGVTGRYSSEAMLVNFTGLIVLLLGGSVILAAVIPDYSQSHKQHNHS